MKKFLLMLCWLSGLTLLTACEDYFDQVPDDLLSYDETFSKESTVEQYLANIYSRIPSEYAQRYTTAADSGPWTATTDEAEYTWSIPSDQNINIADYNASSSFVSTLWSNFYRAIRQATNFINSVDNCQDCSQVIINQYKAEAYILRAYFYYNLVRTWGPVIVIGDEVIDADADLESLGLERGTMQECVDYILKDLETGADALAETPFRGSYAGRMSRPFALTIKEKVLLFAASPLFNGNSDYADMVNSSGENLIPQTYDASRWQEAAAAAKAFMDEFVPSDFDLYREYDDNGDLDPYLSTKHAVIEEWNNEIIYARPRGTNYLYYDCTPYHSGSDSDVKGGGGLSVTQEFVDAFFMSNGRSIDDPNSGYQESGFSQFQAPYDYTSRSTYNQWINREPRFYVNVTYNNCLWLNTTTGNVVTATWYGGNSGKKAGGNDYPPTGYIARKVVRENEAWSNTSFSIPMMRLAEIYLDYAEALNEYDPGNTDILKYVNLIRERAGIPGYGSDDLEAPESQEEVREAIRKERQIELALENVRFFDARRWKIATEVFNGEMHGLDTSVDDEDAFYEVVTFETRTWQTKHNLWPIPQDEINTNTLLVQNSGW